MLFNYTLLEVKIYYTICIYAFMLNEKNSAQADCPSEMKCDWHCYPFFHDEQGQ